jgi:putative membrane protein
VNLPDPGWLGSVYPWLRALHIVFVIFWMAGMFMLPRYLVYQHPCMPGGPEDIAWQERVMRLRRIILNPAMIIVWLFGLCLAFHVGWAGQLWLWVKLAIVLGFTGFHHWLVRLSKAMARGDRPVGERSLRMLNEVPSLVALVVVVLAAVKPF